MQRHPSVNLINKSGFTLIEFCVAVLIMMVGLLGLLQAVNLATEHNLATLLRNEATSLADEQMVAAKVLAFNSLVPATSYVNRKTRAGFSNYSVVRAIPSPPPSTNTKEVSVRVSWRYKGNRLNHTVSTFITNPAPGL